MFPIRRARSADAVRSSDCISPMTEGPHLRTPAIRVAEHSTPQGPPNSVASGHYLDPSGRDVAPAMTPNTWGAERVAVDDYFYNGRPSDIV